MHEHRHKLGQALMQQHYGHALGYDLMQHTYMSLGLLVVPVRQLHHLTEASNPQLTSSTLLPAKASVRTMPVNPIMAVLPFQFSALGVQMPLAKGSLRVYPLSKHNIYITVGSAKMNRLCKVVDWTQP